MAWYSKYGSSASNTSTAPNSGGQTSWLSKYAVPTPKPVQSTQSTQPTSGYETTNGVSYSKSSLGPPLSAFNLSQPNLLQRAGNFLGNLTKPTNEGLGAGLGRVMQKVPSPNLGTKGKDIFKATETETKIVDFLSNMPSAIVNSWGKSLETLSTPEGKKKLKEDTKRLPQTIQEVKDHLSKKEWGQAMQTAFDNSAVSVGMDVADFIPIGWLAKAGIKGAISPFRKVGQQIVKEGVEEAGFKTVKEVFEPIKVPEVKVETPKAKPLQPLAEEARKYKSAEEALNSPEMKAKWAKINEMQRNSKVTKTSNNLYHTTPIENLDSITKNGLTVNNKPRFEGVSSPNNISFSANEAGASYYGGNNDVMIRTKTSYKPKDLQPDLLAGGEGVYTTKTNIPPEALEVKINGKWQPLTQSPSGLEGGGGIKLIRESNTPTIVKDSHFGDQAYFDRMKEKSPKGSYGQYKQVIELPKNAKVLNFNKNDKATIILRDKVAKKFSKDATHQDFDEVWAFPNKVSEVLKENGYDYATWRGEYIVPKRIIQKYRIPPSGLEGGVKVEPKVEPIGEGVTKASKLGLRVEQTAIEKKLTDELTDLPEYKQLNMKEQAKKASDLLNTDPDKAMRIALGEELPPEGLLKESVFKALEGSITTPEMAAKLANSPLVSEATALGQKIKALDVKVSDSPVEAIRQVIDARAKALEKRLGRKPDIEKTTKDIKSKVKVPDKYDWGKFLEEIKC